MATKRSLSLNECVQWVLSNGEEGGAMAVRSSTGLRVMYELEDEALRMFELGIECEGRPLIKHVLKHRREIDLSDPLDLHYRCLEAQIRRLTSRYSGASLSFEVEYVINPVLIKRFRAKEEEFKARYGQSSSESKSILAFHGTRLQNVKSILTNNFDITKVASNTGNTGLYGKGIYFSEFPDVSRGYGEGLLLCRVLAGRSFVLNKLWRGCSLEPGYDSHLAGRDQEERGQELVIFNTDQILPCYVIIFKGAKRYDEA